MDMNYALKMLRTLADGVNPLTGEVLPKEDSCNQVEIVRALYTVLDAVSTREEKKARSSQPANAGKAWTLQEEESLCTMFDQGMSQKEICHRLQRSVGSIAAKLVRLGKIADRESFSRR